jgi:hypothetical protein
VRRHFGSKRPSRANMRAVLAQVIAGATAEKRADPAFAAELSRCYGAPVTEVEQMLGRSA